jgi:hypothetical protein
MCDGSYPRRGYLHPIRQIVGRSGRASPPVSQSGCRMVHTWPTPRCEGAPGHLDALSPFGSRAVGARCTPTWWSLVHSAATHLRDQGSKSSVLATRQPARSARWKIMRRRAASVAVGDGKRPSERSSLEPCRRRAVPWSLPVSGARSREGRFSRLNARRPVLNK